MRKFVLATIFITMLSINAYSYETAYCTKNPDDSPTLVFYCCKNSYWKSSLWVSNEGPPCAVLQAYSASDCASANGEIFGDTKTIDQVFTERCGNNYYSSYS